MSVEVDKFVSFTDVFFYPNNWEFSRTKSFMGHWLTTSGWVTLAYIIVIFGGQRLMKSRDAFKLNTVFAYWNIGFSIFSAIACYYLLPELVDSMQKTGFFGSYCYNNNYYQSSVTGYWGWLFVMSKAPELGDTLFLVLRKKPVIFMHWYHHALTFYYAQLTYSEEQAWARWSLVMNLMVHTVMYFYFGTSALGYRYPNAVRKFITSIQLIQFVISVGIFSHLFQIKLNGNAFKCDCSWNVLALGGVMYLSYLYLFAKFFYDAYIAPKKGSKNDKKNE